MAKYTYKRFLVQKENSYLNDGATINDAALHDSDEWNIRITDVPFRVKGDAKDLPENDWKDEHGAEAFLPDELPVKSYDTTASFVFKGAKGTAGAKIKSFLDYLANGGYFKMFIEEFNIGRQHVRYDSYDPNAEYIDDDDDNTDGEDIITFKVKLRVDDPETAITHIKTTAEDKLGAE